MINRYHSKSTENKLNLIVKKNPNIRSRILSLNDPKNVKEVKNIPEPPPSIRNNFSNHLNKENLNFINIQSVLNNPQLIVAHPPVKSTHSKLMSKIMPP